MRESGSTRLFLGGGGALISRATHAALSAAARLCSYRIRRGSIKGTGVSSPSPSRHAAEWQQRGSNGTLSRGAATARAHASNGQMGSHRVQRVEGHPWGASLGDEPLHWRRIIRRRKPRVGTAWFLGQRGVVVVGGSGEALQLGRVDPAPTVGSNPEVIAAKGRINHTRAAASAAMLCGHELCRCSVPQREARPVEEGIEGLHLE